jgi:hypothetical protein
VPVKSIQLGQLWRNDETGELYLVTKVYSEVLSQFAMLRRAGAQPTAESLRVKVQKGSDGVSLPGYTIAQQSQDF